MHPQNLSMFIALLVFHRKQLGRQQKITVAGGMATQSQLVTTTIPLQQWELVEPLGNGEDPHTLPKGFLHTPFSLTTVGGLVPKKLAVKTEAGDTPNRVNCSGLAKYRAGAERAPRGASGGETRLAGAGIRRPQTGKEGGCPDRGPLRCTVQAGGEDPPQHLPQPSSDK